MHTALMAAMDGGSPQQLTIDGWPKVNGGKRIALKARAFELPDSEQWVLVAMDVRDVEDTT